MRAKQLDDAIAVATAGGEEEKRQEYDYDDVADHPERGRRSGPEGLTQARARVSRHARLLSRDVCAVTDSADLISGAADALEEGAAARLHPLPDLAGLLPADPPLPRRCDRQRYTRPSGRPVSTPTTSDADSQRPSFSQRSARTAGAKCETQKRGEGGGQEQITTLPQEQCDGDERKDPQRSRQFGIARRRHQPEAGASPKPRSWR